MKATKARLLGSFAEAEPIWRRLEAEVPQFPFQSYDWMEAWQSTVGQARGVSLSLVLVESPEGQPWMLLPLGIQDRPLGRVLSWLGGSMTDYMGPLISRHCPEEQLRSGFLPLWRSIASCVGPFTFAHLERQPKRICGRSNPFLRLDARENPSQCHHTVLGRDWESYYRSKTSSRTRQTDRKKLRKLEGHGPVEFVILKGRAEMEELLPTFFAQKSRSYQELGVEDLFADPQQRAFIQKMTRKESSVHFSCLKVGARIAATHWGLLHEGRFYCLLPTYERSDLTVYSPGSLLRTRLMQWCCENGVEIFDFTVGDEPYKERWCEVSQPLYDSLLPGSAWGLVCTTAVDASRWLKRRVKASPTLFPHLLRLRARSFGVKKQGEEE